MKPDLLILTDNFPNSPLTSESWLADELVFSQSYFNFIHFAPQKKSETFVSLPQNCTVVDSNYKSNTKLNYKEVLNCFKVVLSDFSEYPSKSDYFKSFRHNLALIKQLTLKAKTIYKQLSGFKSTDIVYAYWADNLLTCACLFKQLYQPCIVVSRAHGFEIFEEQTKYGVVPFRKFQNKFSNKIFADSKKGYQHLLKRNSKLSIYGSSYVGTVDKGLGFFNEKETFAVVTCSHIRNVKRLYLMPEILKHISFPLIWHVIGTGEDLAELKMKNDNLPKNITINYVGNLTNQEVLQFYKTNHINLLVSLSYSEGLPVSMMEALSFGIPIMSTDVGGCSEICNEQTGILIPRNFDAQIVADKLSEFKNSTKNTVVFRNHCREFWHKNFNAETNYKAFSEEIVVAKSSAN